MSEGLFKIGRSDCDPLQLYNLCMIKSDFQNDTSQNEKQNLCGFLKSPFPSTEQTMTSKGEALSLTLMLVGVFFASGYRADHQRTPSATAVEGENEWSCSPAAQSRDHGRLRTGKFGVRCNFGDQLYSKFVYRFICSMNE